MTFGFSDEIGGALKSAFSEKTYEQERDAIRESDRRAKEASPLAFGLGDILGGVATAAIPVAGALGAAGRVAGTGAKLVSGAGRAAALGAVEGAAQGTGYSEKSDLAGILGDAATGAAVGGVVGGVAGKFAGKAIQAAPERAAKQFAQDITEGAMPTFRRRFVGKPEYVEKTAQILEADRPFMAAAKKSPTEAKEIAETRLQELGPQTKPIYQRIDEKAGATPLAEFTAHMDGEITKASKPGNELLRDSLSEVKDNFVNAFGKQETVPTQEVRDWVTRLLKQQQKTMGGLNETAAFDLKSQLHEVASDFLRKRLDNVAAQAPDLADDVGKLRDLNQKIAVYAHADELMGHKATREFWKPTSLSAMLDEKSRGAAAIIGGIAGGPIGAIKGLALEAGIKGAAKGIKKLDRSATAALARVVRSAREGNVTAAAVQAAIGAGVPLATVQNVLGLYRVALPATKDYSREADL